MEEFIVTILILFSCWLVCNYLVKKYLLIYGEINEVIKITVKTRKTIFFDIIFFIFLYFMRVNFLTWVGMMYYIVISVLMYGVLFLSVLEIFKPGSGNKSNKDLWRIFLVNIINLSTKFFTAIVLVNFVYIK